MMNRIVLVAITLFGTIHLHLNAQSPTMILSGGSTGSEGAHPRLIADLDALAGAGIAAGTQGNPAWKVPPILVVQHGFDNASVKFEFESTITSLTLKIKETTDVGGEELLPNHVYVVKVGRHLGVSWDVSASKYCLVISDAANEGGPPNGWKPSVDFLFKSTRDAMQSSGSTNPVVAYVLAGQHEDGKLGLQALQIANHKTRVQEWTLSDDVNNDQIIDTTQEYSGNPSMPSPIRTPRRGLLQGS